MNISLVFCENYRKKLSFLQFTKTIAASGRDARD